MRKLWQKYQNWLKLGKQNRVYRYTPNVYRYTFGSGRVYRYTFKVYRYMSPENAQNVCFSHIFPYFSTPSTLHFKHTSKPFHISLITSLLLNSSFIAYLISKIHHELLSTHSNMGNNPYINQIQEFVRV